MRNAAVQVSVAPSIFGTPSTEPEGYSMAQFVSPSPTIQVSKVPLLAMLAALGTVRPIADGILKEQGVRQPMDRPQYPLQLSLDVLKAVHDKIGPNTINLVGRKIPEHLAFPEHLDTVEAALGALDYMYKANHSGGPSGGWTAEVQGDRKIRLTNSTPYPCDFDQGLVQGVAQLFDRTASVAHEPGACRKDGAEACAYVVRW
jgi:hypothetical protein